jgi:inorganic pyrophosphatase
VGDPRFEGVTELKHVPPHFLKEVQHFFAVYKELEYKSVEIYGWASADEAWRFITAAQAAFRRGA